MSTKFTPRTVVQAIEDAAKSTQTGYRFVDENSEAEPFFSHAGIERASARFAGALQSLGLKKGDRVALVLPDNTDFVFAFLGAVRAGIVPVPIYPPTGLGKLSGYLENTLHIVDKSGAKVLVTSAEIRRILGTVQAGASALSRVCDVETLKAMREELKPEKISLDDVCFLQFTSGSTSRPKGVTLTHENLAANVHVIMDLGLKVQSFDSAVSWLPLYHDMGLIGFVVAPLYTLVQVMFLPTMSFIRRPSVWLDAIHRHRATITFAPNFAYALATRAVTDAQSKDWDLSCMRALGCGAEPIQADVLRGFLKRFEKNGLAPTSALPSYGMAEATLAITFWDIEKELRSDTVDVSKMRAGEAVPGEGMELVACGKPFPGHELKVAAPDGAPLGERKVGEVWVRGPSVTKGYYGDAAATEEAFSGDWLKTGDLGYLADGELYLCGRAKDLIILNGKNYYPQDIEAVVSRAAGVRDGQCVAFSVLSDDGGEHCVIVAEAKIGPRAGTMADIIASIVQLVRAEIGIVPGEVHLIKRGTLPKTSSGKVRRREAKRRLEAGELELLVEGETSPDSLPPPPAEGAAPMEAKSLVPRSSSAEV